MKRKTWGMMMALAVAASTAACSGSSTGGGAGGVSGGSAGDVAGAGGSGGASGGTAGHAGGGGGVLVAQGALTLSLGAPVTRVNQMSCPVGGRTYEVGSPAPSTMDPGQSVISGENGSSITCSVKGSGTFDFTGTIQATTTQGDSIDLAFDNGTASAAAPGSVDVSAYTTQLFGTLTSSQPCLVTVLNGQVKGGAIWATFSCAQIAAPPSSLCSLSGTFVLENCDGS